MNRAFWTQCRFAGITLILGALLFFGGASLPVTDPKGTFIYSLPPQGWLLVVFAHPVLWQWANILLISGTIVTILGLAMLARQFQNTGDRTFSHLGMMVFVVGAVLWVIQVAFRLSVDFWAAQEMVRTAVIPDYYVPLAHWTGMLFVIYTILTFSGLAAYGGAILSTRVLPRWVGWLAIGYGIAGVSIYSFTHGFPPFAHFILSCLIGILLLLRRYQVPLEDHREEKSDIVSTTAVEEGKR